MIEQEEYCMDILTQSLAIQKSLGSLNKLITENHLTTHIKDGMNSSSKDAQEQAMKELLRLYELTNIKSST